MESVTLARPTTTPSNLARRWLCPGSARMESDAPDDDSSDARKGRLFHRYWGDATLARDFLTLPERELLELSDRLLNDVLNKLAFEMVPEIYIERTLSALNIPRRTSSHEPTTHELLQRMPHESTQRTANMPEVRGDLHAQVESDASAHARGKAQRQRAKLRSHVSQAWSDQKESVREMRESELADAPSRLHEAAADRMALQGVPFTGTSRLTGTPDRIYVWPQRKSALVVDLKSGFGVVERAELNLQLRGYAVLTSDNFEVDHVYVALLQPRLWSPSERITMAHYERSDIEKARAQINDIIARTLSSEATLVAGEEQCRYCRAKFMCPAFREKVALPVGAFKTDDELSKAAREAMVEERVKRCSDEQLEQLLEACKLADFVEDAAKTEARERIKAGRFEKFMLGKESEVRSITNVRRAIAMLALSRIATREQVLDICELSLDKIEKAYRERNGGTWQQARDKVNKVLNSVIAREPRKAKILRK